MRFRAAEGKAAFLDAAEGLIIEAGDVSLVESMTVQQLVDVVQRDVTRGAFTYHWPTRSAFEQDLLIRLAEGARDRAAERLRAGTVDAVELATSGITFEQFLQLAVEMGVASLASSPDLPILLGLWSRTFKTPALRDIMEQSCKTADHEFSEQLGRALEFFGREPTAESDLSELSVAMNALAIGFALRQAIQPGDPECNARMRSDAMIGLVHRLTREVAAVG